MKKFVSFVLAIALLLSLVPTSLFRVTANALTSGYYTYTVVAGEAVITDCDESVSGDITIPSQIDGYSVTGVGDWAFYNCASLTSVTIPDGVTSIGDYAFDFCISLTSVNIPNSVTNIGKGAFCGCISLTSVNIPNSVTNIGVWAFNTCLILTGIWVSDGNEYYSSDSNGVLFNKNKTKLIQAPGALSGTYTIPDSVTSIGEEAFSNCHSLTSVTIPDGVTSIDYFVFYNCASLTSVMIPDSVTSIGNGAFSSCNSLTSVIIPDSVTSIGEEAFCYCLNLTSVTIGGGVTNIDINVFRDCTSLKGIWVSEANEYYSSDGSGFLFNKDKTTLLQAPGGYSGAYTIPDSVTSIDYGAFSNCTGLTSVTIGSGVTTIAACTFRFCTGLVSVTLPNSVTCIEYQAFDRCISLTSIVIPKNVTEIQPFAFEYCESLEDVWYQGSIDDKTKMEIYSENSYLLSATWHYDTCADEHIYSGECDASCNSCEWHRDSSAAHTFDNACDTECNICGYTRTINHTYDNACDATCNICGFTRTVPAHSYETAVTAPTCTEVGYTTYTCAICGDRYVADEVPALGHNYDCAAVAPTCTEAGYTIYSCSVCQYNYTEPGDAAMGHSYEAVVTAPTCTEGGYTTYTCFVCGESYVANKTPAKSHSYSDGFCKNCGEEDPGYLPNNPFKDVKSSDYYYTPVLWAVKNSVTTGTSATTFSPDDPCTRGQIVTFLWRACGSPEPTSNSNPFTDVKTGDYFYKAVIWAVEQGITTGVSVTKFGPNEACTRGQVATFLWRSQGKPATTSSNNPFKDVSGSDYYYEAVLWAVENNVTQGTGTGKFSPNDSCTRGQIVTFLYRALA